MRNLRIVLLAAVMSLLVVSASHADVFWSFDITPLSASTPPGGTTQWVYDITNDSSSTEALIADGAGATWLPSFFLNLPHMADQGLDYVTPAPIAPGASATGNFYHITWKSTAPLGTHVSGWMLLDVENQNAQPLAGIQRPIEATVTPELPPGVLGLLSFLPYGMWRLRGRKRR